MIETRPQKSRERALLIGAELRIDRRPGGGTAVTLTIPLEPEAA